MTFSNRYLWCGGQHFLKDFLNLLFRYSHINKFVISNRRKYIEIVKVLRQLMGLFQMLKQPGGGGVFFVEKSLCVKIIG